jgi:hypothetical protein
VHRRTRGQHRVTGGVMGVRAINDGADRCRRAQRGGDTSVHRRTRGQHRVTGGVTGVDAT